MLRTISRQNRLALLIGILVICMACLLACPAEANAETTSGTSDAVVVNGDSSSDPELKTNQLTGEDSGLDGDAERATQEAVSEDDAVLDNAGEEGNAGENKIAADGEENAETVTVATDLNGNVQAASAKSAAPESASTEPSGKDAQAPSSDAKPIETSQPSTKTTAVKVTATSTAKADTVTSSTKSASSATVDKTAKTTEAAPAATKASTAAKNATTGKTTAKSATAAAVVTKSASAAKPSTTTTAKKALIIVIDAGHGGYDSGANGYVVEKDVNLAIAKYLRQELAKYANVETHMTRSTDTYVSLSDRVDKAVRWNADVVISIHNNAGGGSGSEVIVPNSSSWCYSKCYTQGQKLGGNILAELNKLGLSTHSGVYSKDTTNDSRYPDGSLSDYFTLVAGPREKKILGIIVEHAFVDDSSDAEFLQGSANLKKLAQADARGIVKTYNLKIGDISKMKYDTPLAAGTYVIGTSNDGRQVLDVAGGSKANGANVLLWQYHNASWQKWEVSYDKQGMYIFKNVGTNKVLDSAGGVADSGNNVLTWQAKTSNYYNQRWVLVKSGAGYIIKSALDTGFVVDCVACSYANGTNVALWDANGGNNQLFYFVDANPKVAYGKTIVDGIYTMGVSNKKTQLIEVQGSSKKNGGNVDLRKASGSANQQWSFKYNGSGYYKILNVNSGLALDVEGANLAPGTNVLQYKSNGGKNQLWGVQKNSNGTYSIYSAINGMALDVHAASTANGANVETYFRNGGKNQCYYLQSVKKATAAATDYNIMGSSTVTAAQMVKYYGTTGKAYPSSTYSSKGAKTISDFAKIAYEEANAEGVKAEVLFAQAMLETGNLQFGGSVSPNQCNFGGIGATGGSVKGATFANVRQGLRAQVQHLKAYASTAALNNACVDPRFDLVTRGSAKTVKQLSGKWAADSGYGSKIVTIINNIKKQ